ncbi:MAG: DUF2336 domain-containing protein [Rhizobiaceae bacterium]|nr:DUF2336 domain-containing protein [Rhizobiaceae bacterium]
MVIEDFLSWVQTAPVPKRAQAVSALARAYLHSQMTYDERSAAVSAMTVLLEDPSSRVRFSLADALASSKNAPRHIIMALATDSAEISSLILARSPVFCDGELVDLVASGRVEQQIAIACRGHISSALCGAIAEVGVVEACLGLLMNKSARYSKKIAHRIAERHGSNAEIRKLMLSDENLNADIRVLLIEKLGEKLGNFVQSKNWLSKRRSDTTIRDALDRSSIVCAANADDDQVDQLVDWLIKSEKLTTAYLLRTICMGNITLFCQALSRLSDIPAVRIEAMISQKRHSAFRAAYIKSGMPVQAFDVFSTALSVWQELLSEPEWISRARMPYLVTRQLVEKYRGDQNEVVDELLLLLQKISSDMAREEARTHVVELARKRADKLAADCTAKIQLAALGAATQTASETYHQQVTQDVEDIDEQFTRDMEATIARSLENDIIEISENDMRVPTTAANDRSAIKQEAETIEVLEVSLMSNAA